MLACATPMFIYRAQFKALRPFSLADLPPKRSFFTGLLIYGVPISSGVVAYLAHISLTFGDAILAVMGILAGALLTAFGQIANWRENFQTSQVGDDKAHDPERWLLDSSIAHILAGAYSAALTSVLTIIAMAVQLPPLPRFSPWIHRVGTISITVLCAHVVMSIIVALPNLYAAYAQINHLPDALNGLHKEKKWH